jgi:hypothetical protein
MKNWKAKIEHKNQLLTITIKAKTFSEAFIAVGQKYPGCNIQSLSEVRKK